MNLERPRHCEHEAAPVDAEESRSMSDRRRRALPAGIVAQELEDERQHYL